MVSFKRRGGRRPGATDTRESILAAAREAFTRAGYRPATIRGIAAAAGVDPALVMHFFGNKETLFREAMTLPVEPSAVLSRALATSPDRAGEVIAATFLEIWDSAAHRDSLLGLVRASVTEQAASDMFRATILDGIEHALTEFGVSQPRLRGTLLASQLMGLAMARYILALEPLASAPRPDVAAAVAPTLQRYISGDITRESPRD